MLPPLSERELYHEAGLIVTGRIISIDATRKTPDWLSGRLDISESDRAFFSDETYLVTLDINRIEKRSSLWSEPLPWSRTLKFHGWRSVERPGGWTGDSGTLDIPLTPNTTVKVFLKKRLSRWELFSYSGILALP